MASIWWYCILKIPSMDRYRTCGGFGDGSFTDYPGGSWYLIGGSFWHNAEELKWYGPSVNISSLGGVFLRFLPRSPVSDSQ
jgi:hypothetical protein